MKKLLVVLSLVAYFTSQIHAAVGNPNELVEMVKPGYSVGYAIKEDTILSTDMCMYCITDKLIPGWYVAFNIDTEEYYYITQDAAQAEVEINN